MQVVERIVNELGEGKLYCERQHPLRCIVNFEGLRLNVLCIVPRVFYRVRLHEKDSWRTKGLGKTVRFNPYPAGKARIGRAVHQALREQKRREKAREEQREVERLQRLASTEPQPATPRSKWDYV